VHLCTYPAADVTKIDEKLNEDMKTIIDVAVAARSIRASVNIKNRQPLNLMMIAHHGKPLGEELLQVVADEVNVRKVTVIEDAGGFVSYELKPQLKTLGPKYGKLLGAIRQTLATSADAIMAQIKQGHNYCFEVQGTTVELAESDLLISIKPKDGYNSESVGEVTVILDTTLTPELIEHGLAREIVSKIQSMRKEFDFVVTDRIAVRYCDAGKQLASVLASRKADIAAGVLAESVEEGKATFAKTWEIGDEQITLSIEKV